MKFLANLLVVFSLLLGQFNTPSLSPAVPVRRTPTPTQTATMTPTVEATATDTAFPTDTVEPAGTATPAPSDTETPATPIATLPPAEPQIALVLSSTPSFVTPGGHINIDWAIEGILPDEHELFLTITLPQGFTPTDKDLKYDEATLALSIPVTKDKGQFGLEAIEPIGDSVLLVSLTEKELVT